MEDSAKRSRSVAVRPAIRDPAAKPDANDGNRGGSLASMGIVGNAGQAAAGELRVVEPLSWRNGIVGISPRLRRRTEARNWNLRTDSGTDRTRNWNLRTDSGTDREQMPEVGRGQDAAKAATLGPEVGSRHKSATDAGEEQMPERNRCRHLQLFTALILRINFS